ncbi:hypothetical protein APHAL10511_004075 [Amanita phalloides]|nr:hypothetical protein APHAL10511_004075 [Amanita phalloides]
MSASYSPSLPASVAASPTPAASATNTNTAFRSLRSLLTFGPNKNPSTSSPYGATSKNAFPGFGSMRKSLTRDREQQSFGDGYMRRAASFSTIETPSSPPSQEPGLPNDLGALNRHSIAEEAPMLRSISPGPPLSADLSTIIEADSSGVSKTDPQSSIPPSPDLRPPSIQTSEHHGDNETDASLDLNSNQIAKQVYDAIMETDAVTADEWLNAEQPIIIDADTDEDVPMAQFQSDNASINIECVDPSIVALLTPNNLRKKVAKKLRPSPARPDAQSSNLSLGHGQRTTPTSSSIPRLRSMISEPTTPGSTSAQSNTTSKTWLTPSSSSPDSSNGQRAKPSDVARRRIVSSSPLTMSHSSSSSTSTSTSTSTATATVTPTGETRILVNAESSAALRYHRAFGHSLTPLLSVVASSSSSSSSVSVPPTPSSTRIASLHVRLRPSLGCGSGSGSRSSLSETQMQVVPDQHSPPPAPAPSQQTQRHQQRSVVVVKPPPPRTPSPTMVMNATPMPRHFSPQIVYIPGITPNASNSPPPITSDTPHTPHTPHTPNTPNTPSTPDTANARTAPNTPSSARRFFPQGGSSSSSGAGSISRQNSESGSVPGKKTRRLPLPPPSQSQNDAQEEMMAGTFVTVQYATNRRSESSLEGGGGGATTPYGRASLDSTYRRPVSQIHAGGSGSGSGVDPPVLATSTPFRRSCSEDVGGTGTGTGTAIHAGGSGSGSGVDPPVLATSTPFRRSCSEDVGGTGVRQRSMSSDTISTSRAASPILGRFEEAGVSPGAPSSSSLNGDGSLSPSPPKSVFRPMLAAPFRSRKRSMSVQEHYKSMQSLLGRKGDLLGAAGGALLQHHRMNGASRSNSSLGGRLVSASAGVRERGKERGRDDVREEGDEPRQKAPHHDWLGPRSVKALRAAGLLSDDRERERERERERDRDRDRERAVDREPDKHLTRNSRERSGSVATSVVSGGSGKTSVGGLGRFVPSAARSAASEYSPQNGRAQSRMAFSDTGGPSGPGALSVATAGGGGRRESGTFSHPYLMHSPTLTTSTSGSRERGDTPRSASTAPTSVSSTSLAFMNRDRDEVKELKEKHATETGALLSALSDSQRTTRLLRDENIDLRERMERMEDLEAENQELRHEVRNLRRETSEMRIQLLTASGVVGGRGSGNGWTGRGSGVNTPVEEQQEWYFRPHGDERSDVDDTEVLSAVSKEVVTSGLRAPTWGRPVDRDRRDELSPPVLEGPTRADTPRRHHRSPSDSSSIFPVLPSNMSMLLHEDNVLLNDHGSSRCGTSPANSHGALDSAPTPTLTPSSAQARLSSGSNSRVTPLHKPGIPIAGNGNSVRLSMTSNTSISPTTANFSIMTGSPGSLFLRPEHEVHLGDMETFSLDFGTRTDELGDLDNW